MGNPCSLECFISLPPPFFCPTRANGRVHSLIEGEGDCFYDDDGWLVGSQLVAATSEASASSWLVFAFDLSPPTLDFEYSLLQPTSHHQSRLLSSHVICLCVCVCRQAKTILASFLFTTRSFSMIIIIFVVVV